MEQHCYGEWLKSDNLVMGNGSSGTTLLWGMVQVEQPCYGEWLKWDNLVMGNG